MLKVYLLFLLTILSACNNHKAVNNLKLIKAYEVVTKGYLEPSGLTLWDGEFYTVSDKQDKIYHLRFEQDQVILDPIINIINNRNTKLDFEGISHDDKYFYLVSEQYFQILKVSKDGSQQMWLPANDKLHKAGIEASLFQTRNANFEGICFLTEDKFLLVAEREPRGFMEVLFDDNDVENIHAYNSSESIFPSPEHRSTDFTGLSCDNDVYVLARNAYIVTKLKESKGKFKESKAWSYQNIIEKPEYQYQDMKYGHAEGLVVNGDKVYIILDNNRGSRRDSTSNNSLFFELRK